MVCRGSKTSYAILCPPVLVLGLSGIRESNDLGGAGRLTARFCLSPRIFDGVQVVRKLTVCMVNSETPRSTVYDGLEGRKKSKTCSFVINLPCKYPKSIYPRRSVYQ